MLILNNLAPIIAYSELNRSGDAEVLGSGGATSGTCYLACQKRRFAEIPTGDCFARKQVGGTASR